MKRRTFAFALSLLLAPFAASSGAPLEWGTVPAPTTQARQTTALPPSPCKIGAIDCVRPVAPAKAPQVDPECKGRADGAWCAPGKLVLCAAQRVKASQTCFDGCNATAHPAACVSSSTSPVSQQ